MFLLISTSTFPGTPRNIGIRDEGESGNDESGMEIGGRLNIPFFHINFDFALHLLFSLDRINADDAFLFFMLSFKFASYLSLI